ncbi:hypothetical protein ACFL47_07695 [Candidatus Latescibacterota bacterium]
MNDTITRREALLVTAMGAAFAGCGNADADDTTSASMKYVRVYADEQGGSHFEDMELEITQGELGTANVPKVGISRAFSTSKMFFVTAEVKRPEHREITWHTAPARQFVIWLTGKIEIETSDGEKRTFGPGDIVLAEDTTGKGHISRNLSDVVLAFIPLSEEK